MNKELFMVFLPGVSSMLFALGGTDINGKGYKWIRRYVLPSIYLLASLIAGIAWWQALIVMVLATGAFSLGYGEDKKWWQRILVWLAYGIISIPIGLSAWNAVTVAVCWLMFTLSNTKLTSQTLVWKICEGTFGFVVGIQIAYLLMGIGIIWGGQL